VAALGDAIDLVATAVKPSCTRTIMPWICWAPSPALFGPQRGVAALADQVADLTVQIANGIADQPCRLRVASARLFTSLATTAKPLPAAPARAASMVAFSANRLVCLAIASIDPDTLATCASAVPTEPRRASMRPTASISSAIMLHRCFHHDARLGDFPDRGRGGRLHRPRRIRDIVIGRNHSLGGLVQMPEPVGLAGDAAGDFLQIACDIRKLDPRPPIRLAS